MKVIVLGKEISVPEGTTFYDLYKESGYESKAPVVLAKRGSELIELAKEVKEGDEVSFVGAETMSGYETYRRTFSMLFMKSVRDVIGDEKIRIILHFSMGDGFYYTIHDKKGNLVDPDTYIAGTKNRMEELIKEDLRFLKSSVKTKEAREIFRQNGMEEKDRLFRYRLASNTNLYELDGFFDYNFGYLGYSTGNLGPFDLIQYDEGVILQMANRRRHGELGEFDPINKVFNAQKEGELWGEQIGIETLADLNDMITKESLSDPILLCEAYHESKLSEIAEEVSKKDSVKFIMIAGPSSSGKTTFSQRLCIQLAAHGLKPHYLGVDNYFVNRDKTPVDEDGKKNFESLKAIDVEQFGKDMSDLLAGKTIDVPTYNFTTGEREYRGEKLSLPDGEIMVIEGIHCLNDEMSYMLPNESKFKIYLSAMTQLNVDDHDRIPTTDGRLLRRMVRDNRTRGYSAAKTISMWESVRKGEEDNIFPYQETADVVFNSALPYELAVIKPYVQPLLFQIHEEDEEYPEAKRLLKFLEYVIPIPADSVPANSVIREFIGGGCFKL